MLQKDIFWNICRNRHIARNWFFCRQNSRVWNQHRISSFLWMSICLPWKLIKRLIIRQTRWIADVLYVCERLWAHSDHYQVADQKHYILRNLSWFWLPVFHASPSPQGLYSNFSRQEPLYITIKQLPTAMVMKINKSLDRWNRNRRFLSIEWAVENGDALSGLKLKGCCMLRTSCYGYTSIRKQPLTTVSQINHPST